jgi:hypothetical protein
MKIDLSKYVGQEVEATLQDGEKIVGVMTYFPQNDSCELEYKIGTNIFTVDGFYWTNRCPSDYNIIKIKPMRGYQQLEQQVQELQAEIERLKKQENGLPKDFDLDCTLSFLDSPNSRDLKNMFYWTDSPQGGDYWADVSVGLRTNPDYEVPDEAIIQIQKWVIQIYRNGLR